MTAMSTSLHFNPPFVKSHYKLGQCEGCGKEINRGDNITEVAETEGIILRYRSHVNGSFYQPCTGKRFVHIDCTIEDEDGAYWTLWKGHITDPNELMSETVCEPDHYDEKVEKCFSHLDTNDPYYSEKISAEKLFTLLEKGKIGLMKEEIDKLKQLADIDENGMLNYREFTKKFLKENDNI
jgi:hypothetical protein